MTTPYASGRTHNSARTPAARNESESPTTHHMLFRSRTRYVPHDERSAQVWFYQATGSAPGSQVATAKEIAVAEKINASYVGRVLRLTLLAPE